MPRFSAVMYALKPVAQSGWCAFDSISPVQDYSIAVETKIPADGCAGVPGVGGECISSPEIRAFAGSRRICRGFRAAGSPDSRGGTR